VSRACVEHQNCARDGMRGKDIEHAPLIVGLEMKKTIPRKNAIKSPAER
jgi:hypothetical protein